MTSFYTENLAEFGYREIEILQQTLTALVQNGLPRDFDSSDIKPAFNKNSGFVFLINEDYQVAMLTDDNKLEVFHSLPYSGYEGFLSELITDYSAEVLNSEDIEYIVNAAGASGITLDEKWLE